MIFKNSIQNVASPFIHVLKTWIKSISYYPRFINTFYKFKSHPDYSDEFVISNLFPCLLDFKESSGSIKDHYFTQDLFVANLIFNNNPISHVDIGSRIDGFVTHVASFRKIKVIDIRPLSPNILNVEFLQSDMMQSLPIGLKSSFDSVSCLHTIEHFGLGRYGDTINPNGHIIGFYNLVDLLAPKGNLYFSTPIGPQRIEFNAHRVFSLAYLINNLFQDKVQIKSFAYIDDFGNFHKHVDLNEKMINTNLGCTYGCGIFELVKL